MSSLFFVLIRAYHSKLATIITQKSPNGLLCFFVVPYWPKGMPARSCAIITWSFQVALRGSPFSMVTNTHLHVPGS